MRWENAYFTVEAALVFPFVMGTLLLIIFLFIFQYDRCLMEQDIGMLVLYAENLNTQDKDETISLMKSRASEIYWDKYFAWKQEELQIKNKKNEVCVERHFAETRPRTRPARAQRLCNNLKAPAALRGAYGPRPALRRGRGQAKSQVER